MTQTIERTALSSLISNEDYARKVIPHMRADYFSDRAERLVFEEIKAFTDKYQKIPTQTSLEVEVQNRKDLNEEDFRRVIDVIKTLSTEEVDYDWLVDSTEQFCKD